MTNEKPYDSYTPEQSAILNAPSFPPAFQAGLVVFLVAMLMTAFMFRQVSVLNGWVLHTYQVIGELKNASIALDGLQSNVWAYVSTHDPKFLQTLGVQKQSAIESVNRVQLLTSDNPQQQALVAKLRESLDNRIKDTQATIAAVDQSGGNLPGPSTEMKKGALDMTRFQEIENQMTSNEEELLRKRANNLHQLQIVEGAMIALLGTVSLSLILWSFLRLRRLNSQLVRMDAELREANLAKDRFLASMSHELRTPLNSILGFSGMMLMGIGGDINDEQRKQLQYIKTSGDHLLSLINDILDLANIESGNVTITVHPVSISRVLDDRVPLLAPLAENKGLQLQVDTPSSEVLVLADERALKQILINLINNAIKFTKSGRVSVHINGIDAECRIEVSDTGHGIAEPDQKKLFKGFMQVHHPDSKQEGTGLGLFLSQKLANLMGGRIDFISSVGKGSTFTLVLKSAKGSP